MRRGRSIFSRETCCSSVVVAVYCCGSICDRSSRCLAVVVIPAELDMVWVHQWVGMGLVASLRSVSPGAATGGVTPIVDDLFLVIVICKVVTFFSCPTSFVQCSF